MNCCMYCFNKFLPYDILVFCITFKSNIHRNFKFRFRLLLLYEGDDIKRQLFNGNLYEDLYVVLSCFDFVRMSISVFLYMLGCQFTRKKRNQAVYFMSNRLRVKYRGIKCWNTSFKQIIYTLFKIYILLLRIFFSSDKNLFNVLENCFRKFRKRQLYFKSMTDIFKKN